MFLGKLQNNMHAFTVGRHSAERHIVECTDSGAQILKDLNGAKNEYNFGISHQRNNKKDGDLLWKIGVVDVWLSI